MLVCYFVGVLLICFLDQLTKFLVVQNLAIGAGISVIEKVFSIALIHNDGAGFSMFSGHPYILGVVSVLMAVAMMCYMVIKRPKAKLLQWSLMFLTGGALGNVIDRFRLGFVIDFLKIDLFDFPVFNVADCFVTVGAVLFVIYVLFFSDKEEKTNEPETSNSRG